MFVLPFVLVLAWFCASMEAFTLSEAEVMPLTASCMALVSVLLPSISAEAAILHLFSLPANYHFPTRFVIIA